MKYKKILTWACTAALFLTGCTTDTANNGRWMEDSNAVRIQASAGSTLTRSNPIDESKQTGFNQGDKISVRNRNITVNYTFDGEKLWVPENDKYLVWDEKDLTFEAYYPYDGKNTFSVGYIKKDQSTLKALAQSDYMNTTSNLQSIPSDKHLTLKLERKTARLIFKIQKFNDEFSERVKVTELKIDSPEKTNGETTDDWGPITPYQIGDGGVGTTYTALVIPGVINAVLNTSEKSLDSEGEPQALYLETGTLKAGKSYTYNLIVGKNKVTVGGVTVAEWTPGTPLQGGEAKEEDLTPYVTMTAASKQTFVMKCAGNYTLPDLEYSVNNGTWKKVVALGLVNFGGDLGSLRLRGKCPNGTATNDKEFSRIDFGNLNVKVDCSGDIRTLIDYTAYDAVATENSSFISLFQNCTALKSAPQLPAKALKGSCYQQMFEGCTSLTQAPVLPATELKERCYQSMFKGCIALTQAPVLQATALKGQCYRQMFEGCTSLEQAPVLPATELQESCYFSMFSGCTALTQAPVLPATELKNYCYYSMFSGCTSLAQAPMLSAKELGWYCYNNMFKGCKSLVKAPALPATTLQPSCYSYMFANCEKLTEAPELKATKMRSGSYQSMFEGCTSLVNAPALPATELDINCYQSMFKGCTSLKKAPELRAKKFEERCYCWMFQDCKKLESVTMLTNEYGYTPLYGWLNGAGTEAENRTLKVYDKETYKDIVTSYDSSMSDIWKIGKCTVLDKDGGKITTTE